MLSLVVAALLIGVCGALPLLLVSLIPMAESVKTFLTVFFCVIITDSVKLSGEVKERLQNRSTAEIILQQAYRMLR